MKEVHLTVRERYGILYFSSDPDISIRPVRNHAGEITMSASAWNRKKAAALLKRLAYERKLLKDQALILTIESH